MLLLLHYVSSTINGLRVIISNPLQIKIPNIQTITLWVSIVWTKLLLIHNSTKLFNSNPWLWYRSTIIIKVVLFYVIWGTAPSYMLLFSMIFEQDDLSAVQIDSFKKQIIAMCDTNADGRIDKEDFKLILNLHTDVELL